MYESFEDFNPEDIVKADKKILDRFTLGFGALAGFSAFTALLRCYVILLFDYEDQYIYEVDSFNVTKPIYNQNLPYYSYIFWDHQKNRWNFACAVLFQCYPVFFYGMIVTGFDSLYVGIISKISCQIKILNEAFKTVRPRCLRRLGLPITSSGDVLREVDWVNRELNKELTRNTRSLQIVLSICEKMEEIFTYAVLVQVMVSLLVFCSCLYLISTMPITDKRVIVESIFMLAIEMQLYMYCYFGNHVTTRSDEISLALFEGDWLSTDAAFKRSMLITMTRVQKPITLTIGGFSPLTLATFVTIGRASYSFFAVIKNANI
ncbi:odorant receptor 46a-like [Atheta coriaria]|uniref:odorant receptor 46a-like n=1 Tax=Dalotia coriaria TaxID=877792 RepID=UPI0031F38532